MRTIERHICNAIDQRWNGKEWYKLSMRDTVHNDPSQLKTTVLLWDHDIVTIDWTTGTLRLDHNGYMTVTTKSRMNAVLRHFNLGRISQKKGSWYYNDEYYINGLTLSLKG